MDYSEKDFFKLMGVIESQGGEHLTGEKHDTEFYNRMTGDNDGWRALDPKRLRNCGNESLFMVPYETPFAGVDKAHVVVCAVCDDLGRWPRFKGKLNAGNH